MVDNFPENRLALAITHGPRQARIIRQQIQQYHQTSAIDKSFPIRMGFFKRWSLEVTFEESRQILGVETQRQWSDKAIERTTPALFGLFSLVTLFSHALYPRLLGMTSPRLPFLISWRRLLFQTDALSPDRTLLSSLGRKCGRKAAAPFHLSAGCAPFQQGQSFLNKTFDTTDQRITLSVANGQA